MGAQHDKNRTVYEKKVVTTIKDNNESYDHKDNII